MIDYYFNYYTKLQDQLENEGVSARFNLVEDVIAITIKSFGNNIRTLSEHNINQAFARWPDQIDEEVRQRFNPCLFLGQYLMRQNHNINGHSNLAKLLTEYSKDACSNF